MKRLIAVIISVVMILSCTSIAMADDDIKVFIDGTPLVVNQAPVIINGRTLVPMRAIFEALGSEVIWNGENKTIVAQSKTTKVELKLWSTKVKVNDSVYLLDVPCMLVYDTTVVPIRFVSEALGANVQWEAKTKSVIINSRSDKFNDLITLNENEKNEYLDDISNKFVAGKDMFALIKPDNTLWMWGNNSNGFILNNPNSIVPEPVKVRDDILRIVMNEDCVLALNKNNRVEYWGQKYVLGNKVISLPFEENVVDIVSHGSEIMLLTDKEELFKYNISENKFEKIASDVIDIKSNGLLTVYLTKDQKLFCAFDSSLGCLYTKNHGRTVRVNFADGVFSAISSNVISFEFIGENIKLIKDGEEQYFCLKEKAFETVTKNELYFCHEKLLLSNGVLHNDGFAKFNLVVNEPSRTLMDKVYYLCYTTDKTCAVILEDGSIWTFGNNKHGTIGNGVSDDKVYTPVKIMDKLVDLDIGDQKSVPIGVKILDVSDFGSTVGLSLVFINSEGNTIMPCGNINVKMYDKKTGEDLFSRKIEIYLSKKCYNANKVAEVEISKFNIKTLEGNVVLQLDFEGPFSDITSMEYEMKGKE